MLAQRAEPFDSPDWAYELKWDGIRCLAFAKGGRVELQSRGGHWIGGKFPELEGLAELPDSTVLDGELVVLEGGRPSLAAVRQRLAIRRSLAIRDLARHRPAIFIAFDCLYASGDLMMDSPYRARRPIAEVLVRDLDYPGVIITDCFVGSGLALFKAVCAAGLEGVMAKHLDKPYLPGKRTTWWRKIKPHSP